MEWIALIGVAIVLGIPAIAVIALLKSRTAERTSEENDYRLSALQNEMAVLRHELTKLSDRVTGLETAESGDAERNEADRGVLPPFAVAVPPSQEQPEAPVAQPIQTPAPSSLIHEIETLLNREPAPSPSKSIDVHQQIASAEAAAAAEFKSETAIDGEELVPCEPAVVTLHTSTSQESAAPISSPTFSFGADETAPPRESISDRLKANFAFEQFLGMNLFAKIGIVLLVLGLAFLGRIALIAMGPAPRVALIYTVAAAMLGGGIWLERSDRYRLLGHTGIGGGWALLFFTTYAMHHVPSMTVMQSNFLNCVLMLFVAAAMVVHTLRYRSQLVTGLAFLLAFSTVALSQDTVYALSAGVVLALSVAAVALRMGWFELEIFGILASYGNHFYWLHKLYPDGTAGHAFPEFWPSAIILILYWLIFRISYVSRNVASRRPELLSTIAALANTILLLAVMEFQSTHPELAFYALLAIGALEFLFGQLPITRRRQAAFQLLTTLGALLIFIAVPFKFTGNNIALFWMIAAEALLVAGIVQGELLFRRLGLFAGGVTGLLIVYEGCGILALRATSEALSLEDGILLLTCSVLFYINSLFLSSKCKEFSQKPDRALIIAQNYLGCATAFLGVRALFTADLTAIGWAVLLLGAVYGATRLTNRELLLQAWALAGAVAIRALTFNWSFADTFPHHVLARELTLPVLALVFYCSWRILDDSSTLSRRLRGACLWIGTAQLAAVAWVELPVTWRAQAWVALAVAMSFFGRRLRLRDLTFQEHVLAAAAVAMLCVFNLDAASAIDRYLGVVGCAAAFYAVSRYCTLNEATYRNLVASLHTWSATALLAALAWHESSQPWLAVIWILFAVCVMFADRIFQADELAWQVQTLALLAVGRATVSNLFLRDKLHGLDLRLIALALLAAGLYAIARWARMPKALEAFDNRHAYSWAATAFVAWLLWCELPSIAVAPALGAFGLLLFEIGTWRNQQQLRLQAHVLLAVSFARIFQMNLHAVGEPGDFMSPGIYSVLPLICIYFYVWVRLLRPEPDPKFAGSIESNLIAYFGSGSVIALLYCQLSPQWIIAGWGVAVLALMTAALFLDKEIFLEQCALLTAAIVVRGLSYNIFNSGYLNGTRWSVELSALLVAAILLVATLPLASRIRDRYQTRPRASVVAYYLAARRPDQVLFFAPLLLIVIAIALKIDPGIVTLAWGVAGVTVILLGLLAHQRSYRLSGLSLLLLCVGKIVIHDAWQLDERSRYITFIVLGIALILVSALYSKFREQMSRLL